MALAAATASTTASPKAPQETGPPPSGGPDFLASLRGVNSLSGLLHSANRTEKMVQAWLDEQEATPTPPPIRDIHTVSQTIRHLTSIKKTMLMVAAAPEKFAPPKSEAEKAAEDSEYSQRIRAALREYRAENNISKAIDRAAASLKPSGPTPSWDDVIQAMVARADDEALEFARERAAAEPTDCTPPSSSLPGRSLRPEATCSSSVPSAPALSQVDEDDDYEENPEIHAWPIDSILADPDEEDPDEDDEDDMPQWRPSVFKSAPTPNPEQPASCGTAAPGCDSPCGTGILPVIPSPAPRAPRSELDIPHIPAINAVPVCPTLWGTARELIATQTQTAAHPTTPRSRAFANVHSVHHVHAVHFVQFVHSD